MQQINGHEAPPAVRHDAPLTGPWSAEPVHDALVAAKIAAVRSSGPRAHAAGPTQPADESTEVIGGRRRRRPVHAVRVRIGHAVASVGRAIEGPPDCDDAVHGVA